MKNSEITNDNGLYGKLIENNTLQFERLLPGPIEKVWEYLVDDQKRGLWFAGGPTNLQPGGEMKLIFNNSQLGGTHESVPEKYKEFGDGFTSIATIVEISAPNKLVINWENGIVTFELEQHEGKVKLTLTHEKLPTDPEQQIGTFAGWHTHLNILSDQLNEVKSNGFWSLHMKLEDEYSNLIKV